MTPYLTKNIPEFGFILILKPETIFTGWKLITQQSPITTKATLTAVINRLFLRIIWTRKGWWLCATLLKETFAKNWEFHLIPLPLRYGLNIQWASSVLNCLLIF